MQEIVPSAWQPYWLRQHSACCYLAHAILAFESTDCYLAQLIYLFNETYWGLRVSQTTLFESQQILLNHDWVYGERQLSPMRGRPRIILKEKDKSALALGSIEWQRWAQLDNRIREIFGHDQLFS